jgi:flagellar P-ring protein precursor FlgI
MSVAIIVLSILLPVLPPAEYLLGGVGLVIGLPKSGGHSPITLQVTNDLLERRWGLPNSFAEPLARMLERTGTVSVVFVCAKIPDSPSLGDRVDAVVAPLDGASNVRGAFLLGTNLRAPDGMVYAVAAGPTSGGARARVTRVVAGAQITRQFRPGR